MTRYNSIIGAIAATARSETSHDDGPQPFITISRQAGAGAHTLQEKLITRLRQFDPTPEGQHDWTGIDRELVEMVAGDDELLAQLVEGLGEQSRSWLEEVLAGMFNTNATEIRAYRQAAKAMRALAQRGRVILIGRGGVFVTRGMPLGVHVYLVAPERDRIEHMRHQFSITRDAATERVREIDANRQAFYQRYWPGESLSPERFTVTFNTTTATDDEIADAVLTLVPTLNVQVTAEPVQMPRLTGVFQRVSTES
ncbi:AAA family ATPase [Phycisphaerales bacterium AB-hyl4]|uniref:AAA family ATPase n=1 Tax=Natronomicrosphaera hydrolytica TaxID=3242702 RepID=A0ABV4U6A8_9BACT